MTFQEKYSELYNNYEKAGKELEERTKRLSETNGFGEVNDIELYFQAHKNLEFHEKQFQNLLKYGKDGNVNPETEYIAHEFMYDFIRKDQISKGNWQDKDNQFITCEVGLTNDPENKKDYQNDNYKFPVLNLNHGKECYTYLGEIFGEGAKEKMDISTLDFSKVIDEKNPIYIQISMRSK